MAEIENIAAEAKRVQAVLDLIADNADTDAVRTVVDRAARDQKRPANVDAFWKLMKNGEKLVTPEEWAVLRNNYVGRNVRAGASPSPPKSRPALPMPPAYGGMRDVADVFRTAQGNDINFQPQMAMTETGELIGETPQPPAPIRALASSRSRPKFSQRLSWCCSNSCKTPRSIWRVHDATRHPPGPRHQYLLHQAPASPAKRHRHRRIRQAETGTTTGQTTTVIFDDLIDLIHSVDPAYRALGRCKFMLNDAIAQDHP